MFRGFFAAVLCAAVMGTAANATTTYNGPVNGMWDFPTVNAGQVFYLEVELYPDQSLGPGGSISFESDHFVHTAWFEYDYENGELFYSHIERDLFELDDYCTVTGPGTCSTPVIKGTFDGRTYRATVRNNYDSINQARPCPGPSGKDASGGCENYSAGVLLYLYVQHPGESLMAKVRYRFAGEVPEPSTWALMILGFGAVGGTARRRRAA